MTEVRPNGDAPPPARARAILTGISSRAWEHPADRGALVAMRKLRGFDAVVKQVGGLFSERAIRLRFLGSAIRTDDRQFAELHYLLRDVAGVLDVDSIPELYVWSNPVPNAFCIGMNEPFIVVTSGLVDLLDTEELRFALAHELGHAVSGHAVYRTVLLLLLGLIRTTPILGLPLRVIAMAMLEWARKAELSADRAGLLATQDPATVFRVHMKLAGGGDLANLDQASFFEQGREYREDGDIRDSLLRLLMTTEATHPFAVVRAHELRTWVDSGEFAHFVGGDYPRRAEDDDVAMSDAAKEAAESYTESFRSAGDTLGKFANGLAEGVAGVAGSVKHWFEDTFRRD